MSQDGDSTDHDNTPPAAAAAGRGSSRRAAATAAKRSYAELSDDDNQPDSDGEHRHVSLIHIATAIHGSSNVSAQHNHLGNAANV